MIIYCLMETEFLFGLMEKVVAKGLGERKMGSCSVGTEFQFCKIKKFLRSVAQRCEQTRHY